MLWISHEKQFQIKSSFEVRCLEKRRDLCDHNIVMANGIRLKLFGDTSRPPLPPGICFHFKPRRKNNTFRVRLGVQNTTVQSEQKYYDLNNILFTTALRSQKYCVLFYTTRADNARGRAFVIISSPYNGV